MSTPLVNRADWRHSAACCGELRELFVLVGTPGPALVQVAAARAVCGRCLVGSDRVGWAGARSDVRGVGSHVRGRTPCPAGCAAPGTRRTMTRRRPRHRTLIDLPAGAACGELVAVGLSILDELERRDADGFRRWLAAGARPGGDTARHLATGPGA